MASHACFIAFIVTAFLGGASGASRGVDETPLLIAGDSVLADVDRVAVVLATRETPGVEGLINATTLKAQISQKLREAGMMPVEENSESTQRLLVYIEGVEVPGSDQYVYRVQTALWRFMIIPGQGNRQIQVEAWRVRPMMAVAARAKTGDAILAAVLVQTDVFIEARKVARSLPEGIKDARKDSATKGAVDSPPSPQVAQSESAYPFVASKSSDVFHRSDCRWAQNISGDNRLGYKTREEAVQNGKRPCKSCKP
ncbi:MAG TPA: Ada metal-binding domain-containing protein [Sedimentisphaerales bacterium]|nr:Ada metal-binding domain-containing protein [Sedimentisphaerales bacterium]